MKQAVSFIALLTFFFTSCDLKENTHSTTNEKKGQPTSKIRNDIQVKGNGLKVEQAFLIFEDEKLVPADNKVEVGQWIRLRLILKG